MQKELYFDIVSDQGAGGLYLVVANDGSISFYYHYCSTDLETDLVETTEANSSPAIDGTSESCFFNSASSKFSEEMMQFIAP